MSVQAPFHGPNAGYVVELLSRYLADPESVDAATRDAFHRALTGLSMEGAEVAAPPQTPSFDLDRVVRAARLGRIVREMGHMDARLDPLGNPPPGDEELTLDYHQLSESDFESLPASVIGGPLADNAPNALVALERLKGAYCGSVGYEDDHIQVADERTWLRESIETGRFFNTVTDDDRRAMLTRLTEVDGFEQFLEKVTPYQGQKRFSIEGIDILVPVLDALLDEAAKAGASEALIGMAHRGRLNVLTHVLGKPYATILSEFPQNPRATDVPKGKNGSHDESMTHDYMGDVKYHKGFVRKIARPDGGTLTVTLAPNPSHLEYVNPAVVGRARAAQEKRDQPGVPAVDPRSSLPIVIHGDAAFPGQGVVPETLNMANLPGYRVGGTIHIIANNQIGFTTDPEDGRSTLYASDLAKGFEIPIVHVNADDPDACLAVARMAMAYRAKFGKDFLIDLIGYRRLGHNEADEPAYTQPKMYETIRNRPRLRELWGAELVKRGLIGESDAVQLVSQVRATLQHAKTVALAGDGPMPAPTAIENPSGNAQAVTAANDDRLTAINAHLNAVPDGFSVNTKLQNTFLKSRLDAFTAAEPSVNWAHAEALALGTLLQDGIPVRLTGQDTQRGTFTQRILVLHDVQNGEKYCALQSLPGAKSSLALHNSPLSESAAMGFEYGYSVHAPGVLVLWEAQFGDFANGGQVIIDQFLVSAKAKWGQTPSLVLLLPHGYEGAGPEHSSARLERFLQLGAGDNLRVANCTTSAQYYHLLRRHASSLTSDPRPLVLLTPKSLLRHPRASSSLADLAQGIFSPVLDDPRDASRKSGVSRLILCSGKVYVDLVYGPGPKYPLRDDYEAASGVAIARLEELFPLPEKDLRALLSGYPSLSEVVWLQEEPHNMGAWSFVAPRLSALLPSGATLRYVGRPDEASPAEGSQTAHNAEQARIIAAAFADVPAISEPASESLRRDAGQNGVGKNGHDAGPSPAEGVKKSNRTEKRA